jgi:hypothetical protein
MEWKFNDGGRAAAGFKGSSRDCVARAIAIASGRPYAEVYRVLAQGNFTQRKAKREGRKARQNTADHGINTKRKWFADYMESLGFRWVPTMAIGQGCKVHLSSGELPAGNLVVNVSRHFCAVIDGVLNDTYDCSRNGTRCVYGYYIFEPKPNSHD